MMTGRLKFVYVVTSMVALLFLSSCQGEADSKKKEANSSQSTGVSAEEIAVNEGLDFFMVGKYEDPRSLQKRLKSSYMGDGSI